MFLVSLGLYKARAILDLTTEPLILNSPPSLIPYKSILP